MLFDCAIIGGGPAGLSAALRESPTWSISILCFWVTVLLWYFLQFCYWQVGLLLTEHWNQYLLDWIDG